VTALLYTQNGELWQYASELAAAHARNASTVKDQVHKLHSDLWKVYQERSVLASKLELAQNSKELLSQLHKELKSAQLHVSDAERLRLEAEFALSSARAENDMHDEMLQRKVDTMQSLHWQLDDSGFGASDGRGGSGRRHDELESLERAEEFWSTSRAVLRSAYARFRSSVVKRLRLSRLRRVLESVRFHHLHQMVFSLWRGYVHRRRFMHVMDMQRAVQLLARCLGHWKVHSAVERLAVSSRRRHVLTRIFRAWAREASTQRFEQWASVVLLDFGQRQRLRKAFAGWERLVQVKCWRVPNLAVLERRADHHLAARVIRLWRVEARASRLALQELEGPGVRSLLARRALVTWKELCHGLWRRRGHLLKRFFSRNRQMLMQSRRRVALRHNAIALWAWLRKRSGLRRWARRARLHRGGGVFGRGRQTALRRLVSYSQRRVLQAGLSALVFGCAALKRQRVWQRAAASHFMHVAGRTLFGLWRGWARRTARRKSRARFELLSGVFRAWQSLPSVERRERRLVAALERMRENSRRLALKSVLGRWRHLARRQVGLRARQAQLASRTLRHSLRRHVGQWKGRWASDLYWRSREQRQDASHVAALTQLKTREHEEVTNELAAMRALASDQTRAVSELQAQLDAREAALRDAEDALEARRKDKTALEAALAESRAQLEAATEERQRARAVEEVLAADRARDAKALEARKREADGILSRLMAESAALRSEAEAAREQAEEAERGAARGVEQEEALLGEALEAVAAMEDLVRQREGAASQLSLEQQHLQSELERVQRRLDEFVQDGAAIVSAEESAMRQRASELRVLRTDAGTAEARVAELRRIVLDRRQQLGRAEVSKVLEGEERCVFPIISFSFSTSISLSLSLNSCPLQRTSRARRDAARSRHRRHVRSHPRGRLGGTRTRLSTARRLGSRPQVRRRSPDGAASDVAPSTRFGRWGGL